MDRTHEGERANQSTTDALVFGRTTARTPISGILDKYVFHIARTFGLFILFVLYFSSNFSTLVIRFMILCMFFFYIYKVQSFYLPCTYRIIDKSLFMINSKNLNKVNTHLHLMTMMAFLSFIVCFLKCLCIPFYITWLLIRTLKLLKSTITSCTGDSVIDRSRLIFTYQMKHQHLLQVKSYVNYGDREQVFIFT